MDPIGVPAGVLLAGTIVAVVAVLRWAAVIRGEIHRQFIRRSRGLHLTMTAVAGCGIA